MNLGTKVSSVGAILILFFRDLAGYEVEIALELPKPFYPRPTEVTCLSRKTLSYSNLLKIVLD